MNDKIDYGLISADSHVFEPADLFEKRLPAHLRGRAPQVRESNGGSAWFVEDVMPVPFPASAVTGSGYRARDLTDPDRPVNIDELMPALYDPAERIRAQDADSVDAEVLYASPHLWDAIKQVEDAELRLECARAYNDWISEFCSYDPSRLIGVGKLPSSGIEDAQKELVRIVGDPAPRGAVIDAWPSGSKGPSDAALDPIWDVANEAGVPISLHYGLGDARSAPTDGHHARAQASGRDGAAAPRGLGRVRPVPEPEDGVGARRCRVVLPLDGIPRQHLPPSPSSAAFQARAGGLVPERVHAPPFLVRHPAGQDHGEAPSSASEPIISCGRATSRLTRRQLARRPPAGHARERRACHRGSKCAAGR